MITTASIFVPALLVVSALISGIAAAPLSIATRSDGSISLWYPYSFNNWHGISSLHGFDNFYGVGNFDGSFFHQQTIVQETEVVCHSIDIEIIQQKLVVLQEIAKRVITELICEVETQTTVVFRPEIRISRHAGRRSEPIHIPYRVTVPRNQAHPSKSRNFRSRLRRDSPNRVIPVFVPGNEPVHCSIVFEQFSASFSSFRNDLHRSSATPVGYDAAIASHFDDMFDADGSLTTSDFGFVGSDIGKKLVVPSGSNWDDELSPSIIAALENDISSALADGSSVQSGVSVPSIPIISTSVAVIPAPVSTDVGAIPIIATTKVGATATANITVNPSFTSVSSPGTTDVAGDPTSTFVPISDPALAPGTDSVTPIGDFTAAPASASASSVSAAVSAAVTASV